MDVESHVALSCMMQKASANMVNEQFGLADMAIMNMLY